MATPDFLLIGAPHAGADLLAAALHRCPADPPCGGASGGVRGGGVRGGGVRGGGASGMPQRRSRRSDVVPELYEPYYLADFAALRRLHETGPYVRLVAVLRDPVARAYAHWTRNRLAGIEPVADFERALALEPDRAAAGCSWAWRYQALGLYGSQVQRLVTLFAPAQVLLLAYPCLLADPEKTLAQVRRFLGLDTGKGDPLIALPASGPGHGVGPRGLLARGHEPRPRHDLRSGPDLDPGPGPGRGPDPGLDLGLGVGSGPGPRTGPAPDLVGRLRAGFRADLDLLDEVTGRHWVLTPESDGGRPR